MKILVAYFTASYGNTKKIAEKIASFLGADLKEIEPKDKYSEADLNWMDKNSRSTLEMRDPSSRPELKSIMDVTSYDVIYVGFPVWWYREPSIIDTFLESQDFKGKVLVPFATSGSSSIGKETCNNFRRLAPGSIVRDGRVIKMNESDEKISSWVKEIIQ